MWYNRRMRGITKVLIVLSSWLVCGPVDVLFNVETTHSLHNICIFMGTFLWWLPSIVIKRNYSMVSIKRLSTCWLEYFTLSNLQVTELLGGGMLDMASINIMRGRDHGFPTYNHYRRLCKLPPITSFDDVSIDLDKTYLEHHCWQYSTQAAR